jgi:cytoskeletal protein CcmA (bactofilin family)
MFFRRRGTIIAEGLKITGSVSAEGLVEVNGHIDGNVHCTSLLVSPKATINGGEVPAYLAANPESESD